MRDLVNVSAPAILSVIRELGYSGSSDTVIKDHRRDFLCPYCAEQPDGVYARD